MQLQQAHQQKTKKNNLCLCTTLSSSYDTSELMAAAKL